MRPIGLNRPASRSPGSSGDEVGERRPARVGPPVECRDRKLRADVAEAVRPSRGGGLGRGLRCFEQLELAGSDVFAEQSEVLFSSAAKAGLFTVMLRPTGSFLSR